MTFTRTSLSRLRGTLGDDEASVLDDADEMADIDDRAKVGFAILRKVGDEFLARRLFGKSRRYVRGAAPLPAT